MPADAKALLRCALYAIDGMVIDPSAIPDDGKKTFDALCDDFEEYVDTVRAALVEAVGEQDAQPNVPEVGHG